MSDLSKIVLRRVFKRVLEIGLTNPHTPYECELLAVNKKPTAMIDEEDISPEIQDLISQGDIVVCGIFNSPLGYNLVVLAQKDKKDMGDELYARYCMQEEHSYPKFDNPEDYHRRIGELLGFDQRDIDYACGLNKKKPISKYILNRTDGLRQDLRRNLEWNI